MGSSIARAVTSVARPVSGGSTSFPTSGFGSVFGGGGLGQLFSQVISPVNQQPTAPVTLPITPTTPMSPIRRFNAVVDPKLSRTMSRPMFKPSRYDGQINQLLERLGITSLAAPQRRPDVDQLGRRYDDPRYYKMGGRVNYQDGGSSKTPPKFIPMDLESVAFRLFKDNLDNLTYNQKQTVYDYIEQNRNKKAMGGIMNLKMGGMPVEMDLRAKGGFVPIGKKERADDVPARLSKNEFVFTANAVRNAGDGDIRKGAKRMYNLMHQLEAKK
jgi:hypothetical protein